MVKVVACVLSSMDVFDSDRAVVYHTTKRLKAKTIQKEGFNPHIGSGSTSDMISESVENSSYSFSLPFDRREVTYFHVEPKLPKDMLESKELSDNQVVIVVDAESLIEEYECYVADMDILNDIIDMSVGAPGQEYETIEAAAEAYEGSVQSVSSYADVEAASVGYPELLVAGRINSDCIIEIVQ